MKRPKSGNRNGIPHLRFLLLAGLVLAELGFITFWRNAFGVYISPAVLFLISLLISIYPLWLIQNKKLILIEGVTAVQGIGSIWKWLPFLLGLSLIAWGLGPVFNDYPIEVSSSDIIPSIQIYVERLLDGEQIYTTFDMGTYELEPTYLPLMWGPFIPAELFGIDYRWMGFVLLGLSLGYYQYIVNKQTPGYIQWGIQSVFPYVILYSFLSFEPQVFGYSVETLISGYYILLALSIFSGSNTIRAIALICCLLSRYSLLFWVPLYLFILFFLESRKNTLYTLLYTFAGLLILYVIPFLSKDWNSFFRGYAYYTEAALGEWIPKPWQGGGDKPFHLFRGFGFACYFYEFTEGSLLEKIKLFKSFHLVCSILSVTAAGIYFYVQKALHEHFRIYLLLALKFYFVFFYTFIQQPYAYLYLVPIFISMCILSMFRNTYNPVQLPAEHSG